MTHFVVDASIVGTVILNEGDATASVGLQAALRGATISVPAHSSLEIAATLVKAARRQRFASALAKRRLDEAEGLLGSARVYPAATSRTIFNLAMATGLTAYDAVYLELAERLDATLATNDDALIAVARERGIDVLTTRP